MSFLPPPYPKVISMRGCFCSLTGIKRDLQNAIYQAESTKFTHFPGSGSKSFVNILEEEMGMLNLD